MSTTTKLQALINDAWTGPIAAELLALHTKMGSPEPGVGPSTNAGQPYSPAALDSIGEWDGNEDNAIDLYNQSLDELFDALDIRAIGSGQYYTTAADHFCSEPASPEWDLFVERASAVITQWLNYGAWEQFCADPYEIAA